jgi:hypothetical protein
MKLVFCCTIASLLSIHAQTHVDEGMAARLAKDLLPATTALTWPDPIKDDVYSRAELQSLATAGLHKVMEAYQADLRKLEQEHNRVVKKPEEASLGFRSFASPDQSYKLAHALSGKQLTEGALLPLSEAIVQMVIASVECRNTSCQLQNSHEFRSAADQTLNALQTIIVDGKDLRSVMDSFFRGAVAAAAPPVRSVYK